MSSTVDNSAVGRLASPLDVDPTPTVLTAGSTIDDLKLEGTTLTADIDSVITAADVDRTMDGASTLTITVQDDKRKLLTSQVIKQASTVEIDGLKFRLAAVNKSGDGLTLTFEDNEVAQLRGQRKPKRVARKKMTRAQFARSMVREIKGLRFFCPEVNIKQPVGKEKQATERRPGFPKGVKLKVKGQAASAMQVRYIGAVLEQGVKMKVSKKLMTAAIMVIIQESVAGKKMSGGGGSLGLFHQQPSWGSAADRRDAKKSAALFYNAAKAYDAKHPGVQYATLALRVQAPDPKLSNADTYGQWRKEADAALDKYGVGTGSGYKDDSKGKKQYVFSRGLPAGPKGENSWDALKRLATDVNWRCFVSDAIVYFVSEDYLFRSKPRMILSEDSPGVSGIDFSWDTGKPIGEATVSCRIARWAAPPGSIVELEDCGPADGKWLVSSIKRSLFSPEASITLKKKSPKLPEPAAEDAGGASGQDTTIDAEADVPAAIAKAYQKAVAIDKKGYKYTYGGGHGSFAGPYDCSGAVSAILKAAGKLSSPMDTVALGRFGKSGKGEFLTIYVKPYAGKNGHTYAVFNIPGKGEQRFEAHGPQGSGPGGQFVSRGSDPSGYVARHIEGM